MAIYDGLQAAYEHLTDVARACALAAAKAPTITHRADLKVEIITGEDLEPMIDVLETLGKTSSFQLHDAVAFRQLAEQGKLPPLLLLGADLTQPVFWDCGACGFATCGEYIKYTRKNKGVGMLGYGPSCIWKAIDFGIACDYACACAAQHHAEARIMGSMGAISMLLGRLDGASFVLALPIGPVGQNLWFDREAWNSILSFEQRMMIQMGGGPTLSMAFSGTGNPILKTKPNWWEDPTFMKVEQDEEFYARDVDGKAAAYEKIMRYTGALGDED